MTRTNMGRQVRFALVACWLPVFASETCGNETKPRVLTKGYWKHPELSEQKWVDTQALGSASIYL